MKDKKTNKIEVIKNASIILIVFLICQIILFTMNEFVASSLCLLGLSLLGTCMFKLIKYVIRKIIGVVLNAKSKK